MAMKAILTITVLAARLATAVGKGYMEVENDTNPNITENETEMMYLEVTQTPTGAPGIPTPPPTMPPTMPTTSFKVKMTAPSVAAIPSDSDFMSAAPGGTDAASVEVVVTIKVKHDFSFPSQVEIDVGSATSAVATMFDVAESLVTILMGERRLSATSETALTMMSEGRRLQSTGTSFSAEIATTDRAQAETAATTEVATLAQSFVDQYQAETAQLLSLPTVAAPVIETEVAYTIVSKSIDVEIAAPTAASFKEALVAVNPAAADLGAPEVSTPAPTPAPTPSPTPLPPGQTSAPTSAPQPPSQATPQTTAPPPPATAKKSSESEASPQHGHGGLAAAAVLACVVVSMA